MQMAYEAFGARRVRCGSDCLPVAGQEGDHKALSWTLAHRSVRRDDDPKWVLGKTAPAWFTCVG
jgi:hypothetical protein